MPTKPVDAAEGSARALALESRAREGAYMEPRSFDLLLSRKVAELEKEYGIHYHAGELAPLDRTLVKDLFEAGLRLVLEMGVYIIDQSRQVLIGEEELRSALASAKSLVKIGEGADSRALEPRSPGATVKPLVFGGYAGTPTPREIFKESAYSYAAEPLVDALDHGSIANLNGLSAQQGAPSEAEATVAELKLLREAIEEAGRPGLHLLACESSASSVGSLAAMALGLLRKSDAQLVPVLNEMKVDYSQLVKAQVGQAYGVHNAALVDPVVGGFARGAAGSAICAVAEVLLSLVAYRASYALIHPYHIHLKATSSRECLWVEAALGLVGERLRVPLVGDVWPANGGGAVEMLYEIAANALIAASFGLHLLGPAPANGEKPHGTGLEARLMAEVGVAAARMNPDDAVELAQVIVKLYEPSLRDPNPGKPFTELYDARKRAPAAWWLEAYREARKRLTDLGLDLSA
jgi:methylamine--corrinoid protein Co-methyltransferase